jgi:hypothetical protein
MIQAVQSLAFRQTAWDTTAIDAGPLEDGAVEVESSTGITRRIGIQEAALATGSLQYNRKGRGLRIDYNI